MAFITFIKDIKSSADVLPDQQEIENSTHLASIRSPSTTKHTSLRTTKTSQIVSARQSHYGTPWGVNIPPYRPLVTEPSTPSSSTSSPDSSVPSVLHTRGSQHPLIESGFDIQPNQRRLIEPSEPILSQDIHPYSPPRLNNDIQYTQLGNSLLNPSRRKDGPCQNVNTADSLEPFTLSSRPIDFSSRYPKSVTPAKSITTESGVSIRSLGTDAPSSSFFSLPAGSPPLLLDHSSSIDLDQGSTSLSTNHLFTPSSPRTTSLSLTCKTCRFPFQRTSSDPSLLLQLSHRSPLFDDLDEDDLSHFSDPSSGTSISEHRHRSGSQSSFSSSSPEAFHSLSSWWSDIPPHRRAHIIEAESWPIFTPSIPLLGNGSPPRERCACAEPVPHDSSMEVPDAAAIEQIKHPQESPHSSPPLSLGNLHPRPSISTNPNLLVPIPLDHNEIDPLLSTESRIGEVLPALSNDMDDSDPHHFSGTCQGMKKKKRKEESAPKSSESLLTKSLRRLSRKLPNIQWGNLSVCKQNSTLDGKSTSPGEEDQDEDSVLPSGVVDEDSSVGLTFEDEKSQISKLVKSWTLDNIQPQNSLNGSFINDPEMEWSSMVVQLETFSPSSSKKSRSKVQIHTEKKTARNSRAQQYSRKSNRNYIASPTNNTHESETPEDRRDTIHDKPNRIKKTYAKKNSRSTGNQQLHATNENKKNAVKITKRVVSNPLHLLQLTLELEMMRNMKINSPLKQRSMKLILIKRLPGSQSSNITNEFDYVGSPLRFEVR